MLELSKNLSILSALTGKYLHRTLNLGGCQRTPIFEHASKSEERERDRVGRGVGGGEGKKTRQRRRRRDRFLLSREFPPSFSIVIFMDSEIKSAPVISARRPRARSKLIISTERLDNFITECLFVRDSLRIRTAPRDFDIFSSLRGTILKILLGPR